MILSFLISQGLPVLVYGTGGPGSVFVGDVPAGSESKPVIVFVHGKSSSKDVWLLDNNMYQLAYSYGYRTAFVNLGPESSMWYNGALLNNLLNFISGYFGSSNLIVIAHSKGGIDTETAIYHYGNSNVKQVISLSTPYWGSPLADLAYSWWVWWLAEILGLTTDATYVLQTGYMAWFRGITDPLYNMNPVPTYSYSSWFDGTPFTWPWKDNFCLSAICWGQWYLSWHGGSCSEGGNDGAVTYSSAHKPTSIAMSQPCSNRNWKYNHYEIAKGYNVWDRLYLGAVLSVGGRDDNFRSPFLTSASTYYFARNGETLNLEGDFYVLILGADDNVSLNVNLPYTDLGLQKFDMAEGSFMNARVYRFENVKKGSYKVSISGSSNLPIMLAFESEPAFLTSDRMVYEPGEPVNLTLRSPRKLDEVYGVVRNTRTGESFEIPFRYDGSAYRATFIAPPSEGVYNISVQAKGNGYYRSITKSIMVVREKDSNRDIRVLDAGSYGVDASMEGRNYVLYDITGRMIRKGIISNRSPVDGLNRGLYILKVEGRKPVKVLVR